MSDSMFLTDDEMAALTGRRMKSKQIEWLKRAGVPHWVNAAGRPIIARTAITGQKTESPPKPRTWSSSALGA